MSDRASESVRLVRRSEMCGACVRAAECLGVARRWYHIDETRVEVLHLALRTDPI